MSLHKFYFDAQHRARTKGERYGQAMFNHHLEVRPDLSEQVRAAVMDPFYVERLSDPRWDRFVAFVEANWNICAACGGEGLVDFTDEEWIAMYGVPMSEYKMTGNEPETMKPCVLCQCENVCP